MRGNCTYSRCNFLHPTEVKPQQHQYQQQQQQPRAHHQQHQQNHHKQQQHQHQQQNPPPPLPPLPPAHHQHGNRNNHGNGGQNNNNVSPVIYGKDEICNKGRTCPNFKRYGTCARVHPGAENRTGLNFRGNNQPPLPGQ